MYWYVRVVVTSGTEFKYWYVGVVIAFTTLTGGTEIVLTERLDKISIYSQH